MLALQYLFCCRANHTSTCFTVSLYCCVSHITGRDVSCGTYRIDAVRASFQRASRRLEALARGRKISDNSLNYLQALFDVSRVTKRSASGTFAEYNDDFISVLGPGTGHAMQRGEALFQSCWPVWGCLLSSVLARAGTQCATPHDVWPVHLHAACQVTCSITCGMPGRASVTCSSACRILHVT